MRKRAKVLEAKRMARVELESRMTPEQRLAVYVAHSRLVMEFYQAGIRDRQAASAAAPAVKR